MPAIITGSLMPDASLLMLGNQPYLKYIQISNQIDNYTELNSVLPESLFTLNP